MLGQYLITLREAFEATLLTTIVLAYLSRAGRAHLNRYVYLGVLSSILASLTLGAALWLIYGVLPKAAQALFEGGASILAVFVLSYMVYWMATRGRRIKEEVERRVERAVLRGEALALSTFAFIIVFREGLETVLFLTPFLVSDPSSTMIGLFLGILTSFALSVGIFLAGMRLNMRRFFYFTSLLLILLAGGLAGYGVHELMEFTGHTAWGWLGLYAYDLGIPDGSPLHHKGALGSILAVMFGYTVRAEWGRLMVHIVYLATMIPAVFWVYRRR